MEDTSTPEEQSEFAALLEDALSMATVSRGQVLTGTILHIDSHGAIIDVGLKRDGVVPRSDLDRLGHQADELTSGVEIAVMVVQPEDYDGNLILSIHQARQSVDWEKAEGLMEAGETFAAQVAAANRGGLIVPFGEVRGFIPASHVANLPRGLDEGERQERLVAYVGKDIEVKVIEVNPVRRRLVLSEREAQRAGRDLRKQRLLESLTEGDVCKGTVSGLRDFGAFVDLGGADGLIHISELAWHRVRHPSEVLQVGDEIEVQILRLDVENKRIGLSLKQLKPNPWDQVEDLYSISQVVEGTVSRVVSFGAFIELETGIEALLHTSQISDPPPDDPSLSVFEGERLPLRVISIESERQRMGLSLKDVGEEERAEWRAKMAAEKEEAELEAAEAEDVPEAELEAAEAEDVPEAELEAAEAEDVPEAELEAAEATEAEDVPGAEAEAVEETDQELVVEADAGFDEASEAEQAVEAEG